MFRQNVLSLPLNNEVKQKFADPSLLNLFSYLTITTCKDKTICFKYKTFCLILGFLKIF